MKIAVLITRTLLGLVFFVFGLTFFFHFFPMPPLPPGKAGAFEGGLFGAGYFFPFLKVVESVCGLFLIINKYTAFFLLVLFPVSLNILLFHMYLEPAGIPMAAVIIIVHLFLGYAYSKYYVSVFTVTPTV